MHLTPLQSRLAASLIGSCLLILLYLSLFTPHLALAAEVSSGSGPVIGESFEDELLDELRRREGRAFGDPELEPEYEPEFAPFDRSLIGRAPAGVTGLVPNVPVNLDVLPGSTQYFMLGLSSLTSKSRKRLELRGEANGSNQLEGDGEDSTSEEGKELRKRQASDVTVYLSANTCIQPQSKPGNATSNSTGVAPQLTMYVSATSDNINPGPGKDPSTQVSNPFIQGAAMVNVTTSESLYIGISAPNVSADAYSSTTYNFQVAASTDWWYYSYDDQTDANLVWVDSDSSASLLMTHNLTNSSDPATIAAIMQTEPYIMFAQNQNDSSIEGMRYSYCGLQNYAQIATTSNGKYADTVTTSMTTRGAGNLPKQQFYFSGLNASSNYWGILALASNDTASKRSGVVGGGGHVTKATSFSTKSASANCEVVYNLTFCNQTAYAVPSNPKTFATVAALSAFYDNYAQTMWSYFENVLQQVQCETSATQMYSLARNCTDCAEAYRAWLCSVTIPRCEDFSSDASWLQPRAISQTFPNGSLLPPEVLSQFPNISAFNSSRNPLIDEIVQPGPYKEIMPCDDLCYSLVQSCPAEIGFGCPQPGQYGFNTSYGRRTAADNDGSITCNYPGSAHFFSGAAGASAPWPLFMGALAFAMLLVL